MKKIILATLIVTSLVGLASFLLTMKSKDQNIKPENQVATNISPNTTIGTSSAKMGDVALNMKSVLEFNVNGNISKESDLGYAMDDGYISSVEKLVAIFPRQPMGGSCLSMSDPSIRNIGSDFLGKIDQIRQNQKNLAGLSDDSVSSEVKKLCLLNNIKFVKAVNGVRAFANETGGDEEVRTGGDNYGGRIVDDKMLDVVSFNAIGTSTLDFSKSYYSLALLPFNSNLVTSYALEGSGEGDFVVDYIDESFIYVNKTSLDQVAKGVNIRYQIDRGTGATIESK